MIIKDVYRVTNLIKKTQTKQIYQATHIYSGDIVTIKLQPYNQNASNNNSQRTILHEGKFLQSCQGSPGIPFLVWCGKDEVNKINVLIVEKLGRTLKELKSQIPKKLNKFSLKTTTMIGLQLFKLLAVYHQKGFIHRNLSLDSIQFGSSSRCDSLYLNDFIDSRSFYKKGTFQHIDKKSGINLKKMNQFTSYDVLCGDEPARKDDLQSAILILVCLLKGELPWSQKIQKQMKSNPTKVAQKAKTICTYLQSHKPTEQLFKGVPRQFLQIYQQIKKLQFSQRPDYISYIHKLESILIRNNWQNDKMYDWMTNKLLRNDYQKGGLNIQGLKWLLSDKNKGVGLVQLDNEEYIMRQVYDKYAPFVEIDKLGSL